MKRVILGQLPPAGPVDEHGQVVVAGNYTVIDWAPPREWTSEWEIVERVPDQHPEYIATDVRRAGLLSSIVYRYAPRVRETMTERRWHVREWSDDTTGQRMCERTPETRTYRI